MTKWVQAHRQLAGYIILVIITAMAYLSMVKLLNTQTAWVDIVNSRFTVSIVAMLLAWVWVVDKLSAKRKWSSRKSWILSLSGVVILIIVATSGR